MTPWFIATEPFGPNDGFRWSTYIAWSGLTQLDELVSLDGMLCPSVLHGDIADDDWPHIVNEDFMLNFFVDLDYLKRRTVAIERTNLLSVFRNPDAQPVPPSPAWQFLGYDLVDTRGTASALTNCGGFPDVFANAELNAKGLLPTRERAVRAQAALLSRHEGHGHENCHVWAIFRATAAP